MIDPDGGLRQASSRRPVGDQRCPGCGWPTAQLAYDDQGHLTGALFEHRAHGTHTWPQLHSCEPAPDDCPFCTDCPTC